MQMTAAINVEAKDANIAGYRKEKHFKQQFTLAAVQAKPDGYGGTTQEIVTPVQVRFYLTPRMAYCCVWIHASEFKIWTHGGVGAGGYGYHRPSAAMQNALAAAGVTLSQDIGGVGEGAMKDAILAIGAALGYSNCTIIEAHA